MLTELLDILARGLRLRCPCCAHGPLFKSTFEPHEHCVACGERFEREPGQSFGAVYVTCGMTCVLLTAGFAATRTFTSLTMAQQLWIWMPVAVLSPLALARRAHGVWISIVFLGEGLYLPWPSR